MIEDHVACSYVEEMQEQISELLYAEVIIEELGMEINHMDFPSDSMQTPSYPSGHSLQSRLVAEYYIKKYPEHRKGLIAAAEECGQGRVKAGWHFPSDHYVGVLIATEIAPMVKL